MLINLLIQNLKVFVIYGQKIGLEPVLLNKDLKTNTGLKTANDYGLQSFWFGLVFLVLG